MGRARRGCGLRRCAGICLFCKPRKTLGTTRYNKIVLLPHLWRFRYEKVGDQWTVPRPAWLRSPASSAHKCALRRTIRKLINNLDEDRFARELARLPDSDWIDPRHYLSEEEFELLRRCQLRPN